MLHFINHRVAPVAGCHFPLACLIRLLLMTYPELNNLSDILCNFCAADLWLYLHNNRKGSLSHQGVHHIYPNSLYDSGRGCPSGALGRGPYRLCGQHHDQPGPLESGGSYSKRSLRSVFGQHLSLHHMRIVIRPKLICSQNVLEVLLWLSL